MTKNSFVAEVTFKGKGSQKTNIYRGNCLKRGVGVGAWTVCRFRERGGLDERGGGVFEGVDTPMHTMNCPSGLTFTGPLT